MIPGSNGGLVISRPTGTMAYHDPFKKDTMNWAYSTWTSPVHTLGFGATELVSSWDAHVPQDAWLRMQLQATMQNGQKTRWLDMGNYAYSDAVLDRTSVSPVDKPYGQVETDTFFSSPGYSLHAYQLRVTLFRLPGTRVSPRVWQVGAFASRIPSRQTVPASKPGPASKRGVVLNVPAYSQDIHAHEYNRYGGGGEAWCSPTSNEMVDEYWGKRPTKQQMAWIKPKIQDPSVDYAARYTYDYLYRGTGNWPFNAAYAAHFGLNAEIVQLPSLADLEDLVAHGIPVVTSQAFDQGQITGANYSTAGHLWVVVGFTKAGNVVVNDPANPSDSTVRHVFDRRQFENVWLRTYWKRADGSTGYGTGGVAYIIWPHGSTEQWQRCRRMFTSDVNAAIGGLFDGGAEEVLVNEAHATMRNLLLEDLDERAVMLTGRHKDLSMVEGIQQPDVSAVAFVGYHAGAGRDGVLAHTYLPNSITGVRVNGMPASEGRLNALVAAEYGVPVILVTGDDVTCEDAATYAPQAQTSAVKDWVSRYSAVCRPPRVTATGVRAAAASAVKLAGRREPAREPGGYRVEVDVDAAQLAQAAAVVPTVQRTGERSVAYSSGTAWDMIRCFKAVTTLISAAIENVYG